MYGKEEIKMCTDIRPEISKENRYYISKHRYYELKHFCLQYYEWKDLYSKLAVEPSTHEINFMPRRIDISNPTEKVAIAKAEYAYNMRMIEEAAKKADPEIYEYILKGVTKGLSYTTLFMKYGIPCCKDMYYDRYRKFFWILSQTRR